MQKARLQRPRRSATAASGHAASTARATSSAQACSSLGSEGPHVPQPLAPLPQHSEQVVAQGARPRLSVVRVRHQEADCQRNCVEPADESPRPADAPVGPRPPDLAGSELGGELMVAVLQERASKMFVSGACRPVTLYGAALAAVTASGVLCGSLHAHEVSACYLKLGRYVLYSIFTALCGCQWLSSWSNMFIMRVFRVESLLLSPDSSLWAFLGCTWP